MPVFLCFFIKVYKYFINHDINLNLKHKAGLDFYDIVPWQHISLGKSVGRIMIVDNFCQIF